MAAQVKVVHPQDCRVEASSGAMTRVEGISEILTGAKGIHLAVATVPPGQRSSAHWHVNCESAIYVMSGHGLFLTGEGLREELAIGPGDFLYVPPEAIHAPVNNGTEPLVLIVARNAPTEIVVEYDPSKS